MRPTNPPLTTDGRQDNNLLNIHRPQHGAWDRDCNEVLYENPEVAVMIHTATSSGSTGQLMCFGSKERWQIFLLESRPSDATNDCWWGVGTMGSVSNGTHQGRTSNWRQFRCPNMRCLPKLHFCADASTCPALGGLASANMQALDA